MDGIAETMDMRLSKCQEMVRSREAWCAAVYGVTKSDTTEQLKSNQVKEYHETQIL